MGILIAFEQIPDAIFDHTNICCFGVPEGVNGAGNLTYKLEVTVGSKTYTYNYATDAERLNDIIALLSLFGPVTTLTP